MNAVFRLIVAGVALALLVCVYLQWQAMRAWQPWEDFVAGFVQSDGRVIDVTAGARTVSEGQAYALFFALVANDRERFDRILAWTESNLAGGDITRNLPSWLWGEGGSGDSWSVRDANPATDADLWIAYSLYEAARLWQEPSYLVKGRLVLWQIKTREIGGIDGMGPILIPAPFGFETEDGGWRLNPSYWPEFQLQYFEHVDPSGPWSVIRENAGSLLEQAVQNGVAPDWFEVSRTGDVRIDPATGGVASYDAIRVYLWAGMTQNSRWLPLFAPFVDVIRKRGNPPEFVDPASAGIRGGEPLGYSAAVLPFLSALNEDTLLGTQQQRLDQGRQENGALGDPAHYYDQVLALFGEGWQSDRYRFDEYGRLIPQWTCACVATR